MGHVHWPLFDLRVRTPRLELRYVDDALAVELAELAAGGIHEPSFMPFGVPWTDVAAPRLQRDTLKFIWLKRAETSPAIWHLSFAVLVDGAVVGSTSLGATDFAAVRSFETGSWLGRAFQGQGIGTEMRAASLHVGFAGLGALEATTRAFVDNAASLGVTRKLGYTCLGVLRAKRRDEGAEQLLFRMPRPDWEQIRRDDIAIDALDPCLPLLVGD
jgi:RimJ/RimL family protein N-acetyltransferase